jgi:uncharacterized damage-inducible protein DinB
MKLSAMYSHWDQVRSGLLSTIAEFSEDELQYAPFKDSWSAGQIMLHIADCEENWLHGVVQGDFDPWISYPLSEYPSKVDIRRLLDSTRERTIAFLDELTTGDLETIYTSPNGEKYTLRWIIWHVLEHEIHHRGELSLILGLLGRVGLDV